MMTKKENEKKKCGKKGQKKREIEENGRHRYREWRIRRGHEGR